MKIKIAVSDNFIEIQMGWGGGGVFELGNPEGKGGMLKQFWKSRWKGGGGPKICLPSGGCVDFFCNNPFNIFLFHLRYKRNGKQLNVSYWVMNRGTWNIEFHRFAIYNKQSRSNHLSTIAFNRLIPYLGEKNPCL